MLSKNKVLWSPGVTRIYSPARLLDCWLYLTFKDIRMSSEHKSLVFNLVTLMLCATLLLSGLIIQSYRSTVIAAEQQQQQLEFQEKSMQLGYVQEPIGPCSTDLKWVKKDAPK
jgi:hypothetical protein